MSYVSTIMVKTNGTKGLLGPVFSNKVRKYHKNTNYGDEKCDFFRKKINRTSKNDVIAGLSMTSDPSPILKSAIVETEFCQIDRVASENVGYKCFRGRIKSELH